MEKLNNLDLDSNTLTEIINILKKYINSDIEVLAYGSRVKSSSSLSHEASDLDLVLRNKKNYKKAYHNLFELRDAFTQSDIPILIDVLDWAILPENFHKKILEAYCVFL